MSCLICSRTGATVTKKTLCESCRARYAKFNQIINSTLDICAMSLELSGKRSGSHKIFRECIFYTWDTRFFPKSSLKRARSRKLGEGSRFVFDHAVPLKVVYQIMLESRREQRDLLPQLLMFCEGVLITKEDDDRLTRLGLRSSMPSDWNYFDRYSRYEVAGIEVVNKTPVYQEFGSEFGLDPQIIGAPLG